MNNIIYVVIDVGCLECGEPSTFLKSYHTMEEAKKNNPNAILENEEPTYTDGCEIIFEVILPR